MLAAIAATETQRLRFGPLVSPITFRHPVHLARTAVHLDEISGGRYVLGVGAGWFAPEHAALGFPFPPIGERLDRLSEAVQVIRALWGPGPATFRGEHYAIDGAYCHPKPLAGCPTLLIGGGGVRRTIPLAARYADEWHVGQLPLTTFAEKNGVLGRACEAVDRDPGSLRRSFELLGLVGPSPAFVTEAQRRIDEMFADQTPQQQFAVEPLFEPGTDAVVDFIGRLADQGVDEVQLQLLRPPASLRGRRPAAGSPARCSPGGRLREKRHGGRRRRRTWWGRTRPPGPQFTKEFAMASFPHILPFPRQNPMRARMAPVAVAVVTAAVGIARALSLSGDDRTPASVPSSEPTTVAASAMRSVDLTSNILPEIAVYDPAAGYVVRSWCHAGALRLARPRSSPGEPGALLRPAPSCDDA